MLPASVCLDELLGLVLSQEGGTPLALASSWTHAYLLFIICHRLLVCILSLVVCCLGCLYLCFSCIYWPSRNCFETRIPGSIQGNAWVYRHRHRNPGPPD